MSLYYCIYLSHNFCIHILIPYAIHSLLFSGGSSSGPPPPKRRRRRRFISDEETRVLTDEYVIRQRKKEAEREKAKAERQRQAEQRTKKKNDRPDYRTMDTPGYVLVRSKDWYMEMEREYDLDDTSFWCAEQEFIYKDIYEKAKKPIRPMEATDLTHLSSHPEFSEVYGVLEQLGLLHLMTI